MVTGMDALFPGVAPTGRPVELPVVVVVGFEDGKVAYEHIYSRISQMDRRTSCSAHQIL